MNQRVKELNQEHGAESGALGLNQEGTGAESKVQYGVESEVKELNQEHGAESGALGLNQEGTGAESRGHRG